MRGNIAKKKHRPFINRRADRSNSRGLIGVKYSGTVVLSISTLCFVTYF